MPDFPILGPLQAAYFAMKNKSRSSAAQKWSKQHGLEFAPNSKTFTAPANPMMKQHVSDFAAHSSRATGIFGRLLGMSKMQEAFPQFASNRFRGDWQTDKNICWGTWKGYTVITWDTVFYDLQAQSDDWSEGEYSSILILTDTPLHGTLVAPNTLMKRLSAFGIEEGRGTFTMETVKFEVEAFNKAYRVRARDRKWTYAIIDQAMIEWLLQNKKHTMEIAPGGVMVSTWFTLKPEETAAQLDFCTEFLDRIPEDLKHQALDGTPA